MPALPALLLSIHFLCLLLVTMPPRSLSQAPVLSSVRMGKWNVGGKKEKRNEIEPRCEGEGGRGGKNSLRI